jgi:hypothetical protein
MERLEAKNNVWSVFASLVAPLVLGRSQVDCRDVGQSDGSAAGILRGRNSPAIAKSSALNCFLIEATIE